MGDSDAIPSDFLRHVPACIALVAACLRRDHPSHRNDRVGYPDDDWVVVDQVGRPIRPEWYGREFRNLSASAGLPRIRLHDARHTAASLLAQGRVEVGVAAALLGHDPVVYLQTYVHPYEDAKRAAVEQLAAAYR